MQMPLMASKYRIPPLRPNVVLRQRLFVQLDKGMQGRLTLVSAPAGFGKTTLVSEWTAGCGHPVAWLSLDEGDNDAGRYLMYLVAALRTIAANIGAGVLGALQSVQSPPIEPTMTALINEMSAVPHPFVIVLDDYHVIRNPSVNHALNLLVEHLPQHAHLVIATREDPPLPLAKLRARGQLTELRGTSLRFNLAEASEFLNESMALSLASEQVAQLETGTEGWIAGLQLAAISLRGQPDVADFIQSFTGRHRFVLDYLFEEVVQRQPENVQRFLMRTSILERMCGPLCEAVVQSVDGQGMLDDLERSNLFIVPLDEERRWYRYHHLFADSLRLRWRMAMNGVEEESGEAELHVRASEWYENHGMLLEGFRHAAAAQDVERAARLIEGNGMPLLFRGAAIPILNWLESLPPATLNAKPSLWVTYASALLFASRLSDIEPKLQAAEAALPYTELDECTRDLLGHIASIRATMAVSQHHAEEIITQSRYALDQLRLDNLPVRAAATATLAYAYLLQGDLATAERLYTDALSSSQAIGHHIVILMSMLGLGSVQEANRQPQLAKETYQRTLQLAGESPHPIVCEAYMGLARIGLDTNDLDNALAYARQGTRLARFLENTDRFVVCRLLLVRLMLAKGDRNEALALFEEAEQESRQRQFEYLSPQFAALRLLFKALPAPRNQALIEPLSARELEVLRLIAQGCSNQEISDRLFLALSSVKGHIQHIFAKLQSRRRTEAVARALELGLISL
ncbi:MAG: tetratricopeptide repeat protein [Cohnella sp.]|nr:tetratricopeptide repeat protein [Cohnella sp.]